MKRQIILSLSIWLLLGVDSFAGSTVKTRPTLDLAKKNFDSKIEGFKKVLEEFNVTYENYLTKLEKKLKEKGELDQLLLIRKEKAEFRKGAQSGALKFAKLQQLRTIYSKGRETRRDQIANDLKPVLIAYIGDLNEILKALTIEGKIDEALIIKKEGARINVLLGDVKAAVFTLGIFPDPFIAVLTKKSPIASAPTVKNEVEVKVEAVQNRLQPLKTRVRLKQGEKYRIIPNPNDKWTGGGSKMGVWCDYQGYGQASNWMRMYSRIGDAGEGEEYPVDPEKERLADARGVLYLFVEDAGPTGNEGEIRVVIQTD